MATKTITGTVKDSATGEPMSYVAVGIKGTDVNATTEDDGHYSIQASVGDTLIFISGDCLTQEIEVEADSHVINIELRRVEDDPFN